MKVEVTSSSVGVSSANVTANPLQQVSWANAPPVLQNQPVARPQMWCARKENPCKGLHTAYSQFHKRDGPPQRMKMELPFAILHLFTAHASKTTICTSRPPTVIASSTIPFHLLPNPNPPELVVRHSASSKSVAIPLEFAGSKKGLAEWMGMVPVTNLYSPVCHPSDEEIWGWRENGWNDFTMSHGIVNLSFALESSLSIGDAAARQSVRPVRLAGVKLYTNPACSLAAKI